MTEEKRCKHNSIMFIITYAVVGLLGGVILDTLVTFLTSSPATVGLAESMAIFLGIGFAGGAICLLVVPKTGYKTILSLGIIASIIGLVAITYVKSVAIIGLITGVLFVGVCLFDAILPPYLSCYTSEKNQQLVFSTAIWTNITGMALATFMGGTLITKRFASRIGMKFSEAKVLTTNTASFNLIQKQAYTNAHKDVLLMFVAVAVVALIPILFIKQVPSDYQEVKKKKEKFNWNIFKNKYVVLFILYSFLIRVGASLICPYFPIFLGKLGIDRATISWLVTAQYLAMVVFVAVSPWIVKKIGKVGSLGGLALLSIPFMLLIANGQAFGSGMVLAVGIGLFMRSGLMNASQPVQQSLPMEFVSKELRPAYASVIFVASAAAQFIAGFFAKGILFKFENGYSIAYYVTAVIYIIAAIMLIMIFTKKYNRSKVTDDEVEEVA